MTSYFSCSSFRRQVDYFYFSQTLVMASLFSMHRLMAILRRASFLRLRWLLSRVKWSIISLFLQMRRHLASIEYTVRQGRKNIRSRCDTSLRSAAQRMQSSLTDHFSAPPIFTLFFSLGDMHLIHRTSTYSSVVLKISAILGQNRLPSLMTTFRNLMSSSSVQLSLYSQGLSSIFLMVSDFCFQRLSLSLLSSSMSDSDDCSTTAFLSPFQFLSALTRGGSQFRSPWALMLGMSVCSFRKQPCHRLMIAFWERAWLISWPTRPHWVPYFFTAAISLASSSADHFEFCCIAI